MLKTVKIQKEDDSKKNKRSSKVVGRSSKNINQINQEEAKTEKDYIQGQEHIPEHELDENQENIPPSNIEENDQVSNEETNEKKVIKIRPRETHLKEQMNKIINGDFTQENIDDAKTTLYSNLRNVPEAQESSINYYFMQEFYTQKDSIESLMEKIEAVSREEIIEFAKSVKLNVVYFLKDNN